MENKLQIMKTVIYTGSVLKHQFILEQFVYHVSFFVLNCISAILSVLDTRLI